MPVREVERYTPAIGTQVIYSTRYRTIESFFEKLDMAVYCVKNDRYVKDLGPTTDQLRDVRLDDYLVDKDETAYDYLETVTHLTEKLGQLQTCLSTVNDDVKVSYYRRHTQNLAEEACRLLLTVEQVRQHDRLRRRR